MKVVIPSFEVEVASENLCSLRSHSSSGVEPESEILQKPQSSVSQLILMSSLHSHMAIALLESC